MKAIRNFIFSLAVAALIVVCIGQYCALAHKECPTVIIIKDIPSIREIQQRLKSTGKKRYNPGVIDGKISLTGQTQKAWNNYTCDQFANQTFKPEYYEVEK